MAVTTVVSTVASVVVFLVLLLLLLFVCLFFSRDVFVVGGMGVRFQLVEPVPKYRVLSCRAGKIRSRNGVLLPNKMCDCIER